MPLRRFALLLICMLVLTEGGLAVWRHSANTPSTAPIFSYPPAAERFDKPGEFARVIDVYHADRGAELKLTTVDSSRLTVFYFEWDQVEAGPVMGLAGHAPEECNVSAGYKLIEISPSRNYDVLGQEPLVFDRTRFADSAGRSVFMYKLAWIQGLGSRPLRQGGNRLVRLKESFLCLTGAARVLEAGVFDARDSEHAWQIFREQVLDQLVWR